MTLLRDPEIDASAARQDLRHALSAALGSTTGPRARAAMRLVSRRARAVVEMGEDDVRRATRMVMGWVRTEGGER